MIYGSFYMEGSQNCILKLSTRGKLLILKDYSSYVSCKQTNMVNKFSWHSS
mgnify:FL=1